MTRALSTDVPSPAGLLLPGAPPARRKRGWLPYVLVGLLVLGLLGVAGWLRHGRRATQEWRRAEVALARYDLAAAASHLDRYLLERPEDARGWFLAARVARRLERTADAERCLTRCQQLGGVTGATRLEWDLLRLQQGDLGTIDVRLRQSIAPDHPDALLVLEALARGYIRRERLTDALEACHLWLTHQPEHPWPWLWRGSIYERLNYLDKALADYQRAVANAPEDPEARKALAGLLLRQRQPGAAAEQFESVLARAPDDLAAGVGLAACRIEQGRAALAVPLLDRILEQHPDDARALLLRGRAALHQDQPTRAQRWLREAARQAPWDPEALYQLAQVLRGPGQEEEAAALLRRAARLRKGYVRLDELTRLVARKPDDPRLRHEAGVLALELGQTQEGLRWLQGLLALPGDHRDTHAALAEYYRKKGDPERAEQHRLLAEGPAK